MTVPKRSLGAHLLIKWRREQGLTQKEAEEKLGIPQARLSHFETGKRRPGRRNAILIDQCSGGEVPTASWEMPAPAEPPGSEEEKRPVETTGDYPKERVEMGMGLGPFAFAAPRTQKAS